MYYNKLKINPLHTYGDVEQALFDTVRPYLIHMSPGCARIDAGPSAATFNTKAVQLEGFARLMWGIVPYLAGRKRALKQSDVFRKTGAENGGTRSEGAATAGRAGTGPDFSEIVIRGISNGVDPEHGEFWGVPGDYDQLLVEMAVFGYALLLIPEIVWEPLGPKAKKNFAHWLSYINTRPIPDCNWVFFRILVNCGLQKVGADECDADLLREALKLTDEFYLNEAGDGWYNDGFPSQRRARDYYIPWAMHYYGLIFAAYCDDLYPDYAAAYRERAMLFSREFSSWFAEDGAPLPYGRSLTYRFAQSAFWGALPFAFDGGSVASWQPGSGQGHGKGQDRNVWDEQMWGAARGLFLRNMRWWFGQPAYTETGRLSVGYTYPNQYMAERYNSPNSPLWALKAFIALAVPETHPFWQAREETPSGKSFDSGTEQPSGNGCRVQKSSGFHICSEREAGHLYALNSGQWTPGVPNEHLHMAEKYAKFAYSAAFGFNVITDTYGVDKLAPDNMLLLSDGDEYYRYRTETFDHMVTDTYLFSKWKPFKDVQVETWMAPLNRGRWHIRVHKITTGRILRAVEGGFPLPFGDDFYPLPGDGERKSSGESALTTKQGISRIVDSALVRPGQIVIASPNANIMHPRVVVPTLLSEHNTGESWIGCLVHADPDPEGRAEVPRIEEALAVFPDIIKQNLRKTGGTT